MGSIVEKYSRFSGHQGPVYALEKINDKNFLSAGGDKIVVEWDINNPEAGKVFCKANDIIYSILYLKLNQFILVGQAAGGIHVIDPDSKKEVRLLQYHKSGVFAMTTVIDHSLLVSLGGDGLVNVIDLANFELTRSFFIGEFKLRSIAVHPDKSEMAIGCGDGNIIIFSLPSFDIKKKWLAHREKFSVNAVCYSPDGRFLLSGSRDAHLNIFDIKNDYTAQQAIPAHNYAIYKILFSPDGKMIATASRDKTVKIWDTENVKIIQRLDLEKSGGHKNSVNTLIWLDHSTLLSAGDDRSIISWKIE